MRAVGRRPRIRNVTTMGDVPRESLERRDLSETSAAMFVEAQSIDWLLVWAELDAAPPSTSRLLVRSSNRVRIVGEGAANVGSASMVEQPQQDAEKESPDRRYGQNPPSDAHA